MKKFAKKYYFKCCTFLICYLLNKISFNLRDLTIFIGISIVAYNYVEEKYSFSEMILSNKIKIEIILDMASALSIWGDSSVLLSLDFLRLVYDSYIYKEYLDKKTVLTLLLFKYFVNIFLTLMGAHVFKVINHKTIGMHLFFYFFIYIVSYILDKHLNQYMD